MPSTTSQKMQKSTLKTSLHTKSKPEADRFTVEECDAILKDYGFRPATSEESRIVREAEARSKAKHSKRLIAA